MPVRKPELRRVLLRLTSAAWDRALPIVGGVFGAHPASSWVTVNDQTLRRGARPALIGAVNIVADESATSELRSVIAADEELDRQFRGMVWTSRSGFSRDLISTVYQGLVEPLAERLLAGQSFANAFDDTYSEFEDSLLATSRELMIWAPLLGFDLDEPDDTSIEIDSDTLLRRMSDFELGTAIEAAAGPVVTPSGIDHYHIGHDRWAVVRSQSETVRAGLESHPAPDPNDAVSRAIVALEGDVVDFATAVRLVVGGAVGRGSVLVRLTPHVTDTGSSTMATMETLRPPTTGQLARLSAADLQRVLVVYRLLKNENVRSNRLMQLALRRVLVAGARERVEDRLVDLVVALEALMAGGAKDSLSYRLKIRAAILLRGTRDLEKLMRLVSVIYDVRSAVVHGSSNRKDTDPETVRSAAVGAEELVKDVLSVLLPEVAAGGDLDGQAWKVREITALSVASRTPAEPDNSGGCLGSTSF